MNWEMVKLGDAATFVNGYPFKPTDWSTEGVEIIRIQNLTKSSCETNYYNGNIPEKYSVKYGDILVSWSGSLGVFEWEKESGWLNQHIFKVILDKKEIDKVFFKFLLLHFLDEMKENVHGATMQHITKGKFDNIEIPLPPLPIQKRIAEILDKADTLRRKDQELLKKYDELAQAIFIDMFGDPVKNEKGWEVSTIGDVCYSVKDGPHVSPKYVENGIPFISVNNIINGVIDLSNARNITYEDFKSYSKKGKPDRDDILYTKGGTTGFAKRVDVDFDFMNWVHIAVLKFRKDIIDSVFFEYMLNSHYCYAQSQKYTRGIANRDLVLGQMKKISILLPPLYLQKKFGGMVLLMERQRLIATDTSNYSESLFHSLLNQLFNQGIN